jgi:hypothetical protein
MKCYYLHIQNLFYYIIPLCTNRFILFLSIIHKKIKTMNTTHYQYRMDKIMGFMYKHRTLRTLFDHAATEWMETSTEKKLMLLEILLDSGYALQKWIADYKYYYEKEEYNKEYVTITIDSSLVYLYERASADLRNKIFKQLISDTVMNKPDALLNTLQQCIIDARQMYG